MSESPTSRADRSSLPDSSLLLVALARALHQVGQPAHRIEQTLGLAAQRLGVDFQVFCLPTGLILSLGGENGPITFAIRENLNPVDLERLVRITAVADELIRGALAPERVKPRIDEIMAAPARWAAPALVLAYVLSAAAFSVFFGGGT